MRNNNNHSNATTIQSNLKPVLEDRQATHTGENVERESTKHNADKAVSCNSTATDERSQQKLHKSCDKTSFGDQFNSGEDYQVVLETESWRTAKNWRSVGTRTDQGKSSTDLTNFHLFFAEHFTCRYLSTCSILSRCSRWFSKITVQKPVYEYIFFLLLSLERDFN